MQPIIYLLINTIAVLISGYILPGVTVQSFWIALIVAIVLGVVNTFIKPLLVLLTLPVTVITFGLFVFVINALLVLLVEAIVPGFGVANFWWALLFSLVVSLVSTFLFSLAK